MVLWFCKKVQNVGSSNEVMVVQKGANKYGKYIVQYCIYRHLTEEREFVVDINLDNFFFDF